MPEIDPLVVDADAPVLWPDVRAHFAARLSAAKIPQREIARRGRLYGQNSISKLLGNAYLGPSVDTLLRALHGLGVRPSRFFAEIEGTVPVVYLHDALPPAAAVAALPPAPRRPRRPRRNQLSAALAAAPTAAHSSSTSAVTTGGSHEIGAAHIRSEVAHALKEFAERHEAIQQASDAQWQARLNAVLDALAQSAGTRGGKRRRRPSPKTRHAIKRAPVVANDRRRR